MYAVWNRRIGSKIFVKYTQLSRHHKRISKSVFSSPMCVVSRTIELVSYFRIKGFRLPCLQTLDFFLVCKTLPTVIIPSWIFRDEQYSLSKFRVLRNSQGSSSINAGLVDVFFCSLPLIVKLLLRMFNFPLVSGNLQYSAVGQMLNTLL